MRSQRGYTIIEVLIAVIIFAIVLPGLTVFVVSARKTLTTSSRFEQGTLVAQKVLDSLSLIPSSLLPSSGVASDTMDGTAFTVNWNRTVMTAGGKGITLTAHWTLGGKDRNTILQGALR